MYCIYVGGVVDFGLIVVGKRTALELNYRVQCTYSSVCVCISVCVCVCVLHIMSVATIMPVYIVYIKLHTYLYIYIYNASVYTNHVNCALGSLLAT